jgi:hypothetical protein
MVAISIQLVDKKNLKPAGGFLRSRSDDIYLCSKVITFPVNVVRNCGFLSDGLTQ